MTDEFFMGEAIREAQLALAEGELPVGAVIARDGVLIARGHNRREAAHDPTCHAEIEAIRAAAIATGDWRLPGATIYVTLEPCPMCAGAIGSARLARLVYGARDEKYGCAGSVYRIPEDPAFGWYCKSEGGVMQEECACLLRAFFARARQ